MRLLHLTGSPTDDFHADLSRRYAADCLAALAPHGHEAVIAWLTPDRCWRFPDGLAPEQVAAARPLGVADAVARLVAAAPDAVLPQLFCRAGMTSYRALFDVLDIPLVGNGATAMALAADKPAARTLVAAAGVAVPDGQVVSPGGQATLTGPVVVKPVAADNSHGVTLVTADRDLPAALSAAWAAGGAALVERYVPPGREVRCGLVVRDGELVGLPLEEYAVDPDTHPIRLAEDKLGRDTAGDIVLLAKDPRRSWTVPVSDPLTPAVWAAARRAHRALGCRHYSLFDFRVDDAGTPWFLEASPYCSFAPGSVLATMAAAAGEDIATLLDHTVAESARERRP